MSGRPFLESSECGLALASPPLFPKWVEMDEKETINSDDGTIAKTYEIRYAGLKGKTKHMFSWTWEKPVLQPS